MALAASVICWLCLAADVGLSAQRVPTFSIAGVQTAGDVEDVALADVDNDGLLDILVADFNGRAAIVMLAHERGEFLRTDVIGVPGNPSHIAVADFDGDGAMDMALALWREHAEGSVALYKGDGQGRFAFQDEIVTGSAAAILAADIDQDGYVDLILSLPGHNRISLLYGRGVFDFSPTLHLNAGPNPSGLALADFNGDGRTDIVFSSPVAAASTVAIMAATGSRQFSFPTSRPTALPAAALAVADFNQDGHADVAVTDATSGSVALFFGTGTGELLDSRTVPSGGTQSYGLAVADFDGDGLPDVVSANSGTGTATLLMGRRDGSFDPAQALIAMPGAWRLAAGDVNGNGRNDLVIARRSGQPGLAVLVNGGSNAGLCATPRPVEGWVCVGGGWVPPTHPSAQAGAGTAPPPSPLSASGGPACPGTVPVPGWVCVGGGWVPPTHPSAQAGAGTAPPSSPIPDGGGVACPGTVPVPGWVCVGGGWVPPTHPSAQAGAGTAPAPSPIPDGGGVACPGTVPVPGWVCVGGGWVPPTHPSAQAGAATAPPPSPIPDGGGVACQDTVPVSGWVCVGGGWVPPPDPSPQPPPATAAPPEPVSDSDGCQGMVPVEGWMCVAGGWVPPPDPSPQANADTVPAPGTTPGGSGPLAAPPPPRYVAFVASSDHATNVTTYVLKVFASTANPAIATPLAMSDLGKPAPSTDGEIMVERTTFFTNLATGSYRAVVTAVGPGGETSSASVTFSR